MNINAETNDNVNLYNKYRPLKFEDVYGQNFIRILKAQIANNNHANTYLFSGVSGTGKTTVARIVSMALQCQNKNENSIEPCGVCNSCKQIISDTSRDVKEINCAVHGGVDEIRAVIAEQILIAPTTGDYRIFILDECHMLTTHAQNALLKDMEEPPAYVKFFLCTTDVHKILNTIKTRCQHFVFKRVSNEDLLTILQKVVKEECIEFDDKGINLIVQSAQGSPRSALSLLYSIMAVGATEENVREALCRAPRQIAINLLNAIRKIDRADAIQVIAAANAEGRDIVALVEECVRIIIGEVIPSKLAKGDNNVEPLVNIALGLLDINSKIRQNVPGELIIPVGVLNVIDKFALAKDK